MRRKAERESEASKKEIAESSSNHPLEKNKGEEKRPVGRKLLPARKEEPEGKSEVLVATMT